jgi:hypothetical protein
VAVADQHQPVDAMLDQAAGVAHFAIIVIFGAGDERHIAQLIQAVLEGIHRA